MEKELELVNQSQQITATIFGLKRLGIVEENAMNNTDSQSIRIEENHELKQQDSHKKRNGGGLHHRIGNTLSVNQDFFAFAFLSKLSHIHLKVVLFQAQQKREISAKKQDEKAARSRLEIAEKDLIVLNQ